jgi:hypothetical protein
MARFFERLLPFWHVEPGDGEPGTPGAFHFLNNPAKGKKAVIALVQDLKEPAVGRLALEILEHNVAKTYMMDIAGRLQVTDVRSRGDIAKKISVLENIFDMGKTACSWFITVTSASSTGAYCAAMRAPGMRLSADSRNKLSRGAVNNAVPADKCCEHDPSAAGFKNRADTSGLTALLMGLHCFKYCRGIAGTTEDNKFSFICEVQRVEPQHLADTPYTFPQRYVVLMHGNIAARLLCYFSKHSPKPASGCITHAVDMLACI